MLFGVVTEPFPNRLRVLRAEHRLNQWAVAELAGISKNRYWRIEAGRIEPTADEKVRLADAFGVPVKKAFPSKKTATARKVA